VPLSLNVHYTRTIDDTVAVLVDECNVGDVVVTMGAGNVFRLGPRLLAEL
jgi:UDP-N-acetylmuramate-alanine ligase